MQMMIFMTTFDIIGSAAYAFTSLPTPSEDYLNGSHGNDATCTAQGFFIQVGTVAAYMNISLAFYYYLAITRGMSKERFWSYRHCFFLCPMIVELAFAFAGKSCFGVLNHFMQYSNYNHIHRFDLLRKCAIVVVRDILLTKSYSRITTALTYSTSYS